MSVVSAIIGTAERVPLPDVARRSSACAPALQPASPHMTRPPMPLSPVG